MRAQTPKTSHRFKGLNRVKQITASHCGPAVLVTLLSHFGIEVTQEKIVEAAGIEKTVISRGMSVEQMARAINTAFPSMSFWVKRESEVEDLTRLVREYNYPVGINWQGIFKKGCEYDVEGIGDESDGSLGEDGHYSVVIDVDPVQDFVRIADPYGSYAGKDRFFGIKKFVKRWWDDRMDYSRKTKEKKYVYENRLSFLVIPSAFDFPVELGMIKLT